MAGKMQGIEVAFNRLNDPNLLSNLQKATKGTVSNLQLMQNAVKAKNLGVPVEKLGTLFEFARRRAKETGESVDYLVESVVTGIGRKSPLILDNLGISASALKEEFKKTGDFGLAASNIISNEMQNMSPDIDTAAEATARLSAQWDNAKTSIGLLIAQGIEPFIPLIEDATRGIMDFAKGSEALRTERFVGGLNSIKTAGIEAANETAKQFEKVGLSGDKLNEALGRAAERAKNFAREAKARGDLKLGITYIAEAEALLKLNGSIKTTTTSTAKLTKAQADAAEKARRLKDNFKEINNIKVSFGRISKETTAAFSGMLEGLGTEKKKMIIPVTPTLKMDSGEGIKESTGTIFAELTDIVTNAAAGFAEMGATVIGEAMGTMFAGGDVSEIGQDFLLGVAGMINSIGQQIIALGIAAVLAKEALKGLFANPALAIAAGVGLVAISSAMTSVLSQDPTAFAQGGLVTGATMGLVGEGVEQLETIPKLSAH